MTAISTRAAGRGVDDFNVSFEVSCAGESVDVSGEANRLDGVVNRAQDEATESVVVDELFVQFAGRFEQKPTRLDTSAMARAWTSWTASTCVSPLSWHPPPAPFHFFVFAPSLIITSPAEVPRV